MKERPILFSAPMVRAILAASKTQTRRPLKHQPFSKPEANEETGVFDVYAGDELSGSLKCPYGQPGDHLWVREAIRLIPGQDPDDGLGPVLSIYDADGELTPADAWPWKRSYLPPMHCPRGLSRIALEITGVRVERLQEISEADAQAEGVAEFARGALSPESQVAAPIDQFRWLWGSVNGPDAWAANPYVWVMEFRRVSPERD